MRDHKVILANEHYSSESPVSLSTPILFLIFSRPKIIKQVFNAIQQAKPPRLYVAGDGPRSKCTEDEENCKLARSIATNVDWDCEVKHSLVRQIYDPAWL